MRKCRRGGGSGVSGISALKNERKVHNMDKGKRLQNVGEVHNHNASTRVDAATERRKCGDGGEKWQTKHAKSRERSERTLAFGNKVAKNVAGGIGRLVPPLSPKIENFRGPHM